jgi:hypothetical protein
MNCLLIIGSKCSKKDENPSMLWHKCLGHIFRPRIQRLIKDNILSRFDFSDLETYVDCLNGTLTAKSKNTKGTRM